MASQTLTGISGDFNTTAFKDAVAGYFTQRLALLNSLLMEIPDSVLSPNEKGFTASFPNFDTITGDADQITSSLTTTVNAIGLWTDIAAWVEREKAWGADQIIKTVTGYDIVEEVARQLGEYWANEVHKSWLKTADGVFATALATTHIKDDGQNTINLTGINAAKYLLGDNMDVLDTIVMNSKVYTDALDARILYQTNSTGDTIDSGRVDRISGLNVKISDKLAVSSGQYPTYIGAKGSGLYKFRKRAVSSLTNANLFDVGMIEVELARVSTTAGGQDVLISRASYLTHIPGVQFDGTVASNPTDAELATATTWTKVADDDKKIKLVKYLSA